MKNLKYLLMSLGLLPFIASAMLIFKSYEAAAADNWYLKGTMGMNHIPKQKIKDNQLEGNLKLKKQFPVIGIGAGYEFDNDIRIETMFDYYFLFTQLERSRIHDETFNISINTKISDLMVNVIKSFPVEQNTKIYLGAGTGVSSIEDEATGYSKDEDNNCYILEPITGKNIYRFAYKLTAGIEYQLHDGIKGELSYNYYNLGKSKSTMNDGVDSIQRRKFLIHNLTLGLRFEL